MALTNFYLELLNKQMIKLKKVIDEKDSYPADVYNCILAGILIQSNSVLESCMLELHSKNFSSFTSAIYSARQLIVHYSDYRSFDDLEKISKDILEKFNKAYPHERDYFNKLLKYESKKESNVVIKKSSDVVYDEFTKSYVFKKDGMEIAVSADKVTVIKDFKKKKDLAYIVNCESNMNYFYMNPDYEMEYVQLKAPKELQDFFIKNFKPLAVDYIGHKEMAKDILTNFFSGSYSVIKTQSVPQSKHEKEFYTDTSKLLSDFFDRGVVYKEFLGERAYINRGAPEIRYDDYNSIKRNASETLANNISERDFFFIKKCEAMMNDIEEDIKKTGASLDEETLSKMEISMLINFVDQSVKNLSNTFIHSHPEFENLYIRLLDYRNFFAHNIYQLKPELGTRIREEFVDVSRGFVNILSSLNIEKITKPLEKDEKAFLALEKDPKNFINFKYEQFLKVDPVTYIGNKLYYSTRGSDYERVIGIIPTDKHGDYRASFYEQKDDGFTPKTVKGQGGKKKHIFVNQTNLSSGEDLLMDVNIRDLLYINAAYAHKCDDESIKKSLRRTSKKMIIFAPSEDNNNTSHAASLNHLISNYYQQRYLPYELARRTQIRFAKTKDNEGYFEILDIDGNLIAEVVDEKLFKKYNMEKDKNQVFSVSTIPYDFSKKRG